MTFTSFYNLNLQQSHLAAIKERPRSHAIFTPNRFRIRRDHILEDAFNQLSALPEEDLRGVVISLLCIIDFRSHLYSCIVIDVL